MNSIYYTCLLACHVKMNSMITLLGVEFAFEAVIFHARLRHMNCSVLGKGFYERSIIMYKLISVYRKQRAVLHWLQRKMCMLSTV